jgi:uncharacterized radical SAM protein YgiQ
LDSQADLLIYGMGERPVVELVRQLGGGVAVRNATIRQTVRLTKKEEFTPLPSDVVLAPYEACMQDKLLQARNFRHIEEQSNLCDAARIIQATGESYAVVDPPYPAATQPELDAVHELPFTRLPHPKYAGKHIPAYEMIKFSVNIHRGCFGGCAFCTISAHQGKFVVSRSQESILKEVKLLTERPDFKGYLSDLGGPSANMYAMGGKDVAVCRKCRKNSCIHPAVCPNLNTDHSALMSLYRAIDRIEGVCKSFVGSGIRYDLLLHRDKDERINNAALMYTNELITKHVSGRLKVAPEHCSDNVVACMRKPSFTQFRQFKRIFDRINCAKNLNQQLIPYFISSHPGCRDEDMAELAVETKSLNIKPEQVQDFTPTPMTLATEMYYTGYDPYSLERVYSARSKEEKLSQRNFFFWYDAQFRPLIIRRLKQLKRLDLVKKLFG